MLLDTRTIVLVDTIIVLALAAALQFYRAHQRTYSGFEHWVLGTWMMAAGYLSVGLRGLVPDVAAIFATNAVFTLTAVVRLDGTIRFTEGRELRRRWYLLPILVAVICVSLPVFQDIARRSLVTACVVGGLSAAIGVQFIRRSPATRRNPYLVVGLLHIVFATGLVVRSVIWLRAPGIGMLDPNPLQQVFFVAIGVFEVIWAVAFTMMNGNRLESELRESQRQLAATVSELQAALGEVRTLSGLLPVCCSCARIRDDEGYWKQLHEYLAVHQGVQFSHGICPECAAKLYPEFSDKPQV